jgi:C-terminal processing protease CtpA/Prc
MEKIMMITLICISLFYCSSCKNNSRANGSEPIKKGLAQKEKKPLIALCQLWGFLKYHHPAVAEGNYDWDMELVKLIPSICEAKNDDQWKKILDNWINTLPPVAENTDKKLPDMEAKTKPDYSELFNPKYFYPQTIEKIKFILNNAVITSNHYVIWDSNSGHLNITNEPLYEELLFPDLSYQLLSLFKYWNIVNYFFPYRDLCDQKWSDVLDEMLSDFVYAENQKQYIFACKKLITKIDDSHAGFLSTNNNDSILLGTLKPPFETQFIEDKLVVTMFTGEDAYLKEKIKIGDVITAKNGEPIENIIKRMLPYTSASNYAVKLRGISERILRENSRQVVLTVQREEKTFDIVVSCYDVEQLNIYNPHPEQEGYQVLDNNIGYMLPSSCKAEDRNNGIKKLLNGTKGVIIDLRCYPSDYMSFSFVEHLHLAIRRHALVSIANISYPGYFFIVNGKPSTEKNQTSSYKNKIVVLVNEYTQSQAEDHVLSYQLIPNAVVIGSTTAGADGRIVGVKDGKIVGFNLPGGLVTTFTGIGVYYPDGSDLQRVGVKIDEIVKPTIAGIKAGRDEVLERAIEIIETKRDNF